MLVGNGTSGVLQPTNLHYDDTNNYLGIGTTAPAQTLHVVGSTIFRNNSSAFAFNVTNSNNNSMFSVRDDGLVSVNSLSIANPRNINGTSFNGTSDIITANWGTPRNVTIGATTRSVNGSGNVTWSLDDIQAEYRQPINTIRSSLAEPTVRQVASIHGVYSNKFRFLAPTLQEESTDGINWTTSTRASSNVLADLMLGEGQGTALNAIPNGTVGTYGGYRLTWEVTGQTGYVWLNDLYLFLSTRGNTITIKIEKRVNSTETWELVYNSSPMSNYPGHVYIPHTAIRYHPTSTGTGDANAVRITFETNRSVDELLQLYAIEWLGGYPLGKRNVESYDRDRNVTFPSGVYSSATLQMLQPAGGIGRVSVTNGLTTVTGERTQFLTTFKVGDDITVVGDNSAIPPIPAQTRTISAIASNTSLTVSSSFATTRTNVGYTLAGGSRFAVTGNGNVGIGGAITNLTTMAGASMAIIAGNVGIGTNAPAYRLDVNGNFRADSIFTDIAGNAVFSTSDARLKKNIEPVPAMLQKITALNPVTYEWNDLKIDQAINRENTAHLYGKKIGLIAQEVYEVFPDFVGTDADGNMVLSYGAFIVPMLKAIQEQQAQIEQLKQRITQLENK